MDISPFPVNFISVIDIPTISPGRLVLRFLAFCNSQSDALTTDGEYSSVVNAENGEPSNHFFQILCHTKRVLNYV